MTNKTPVTMNHDVATAELGAFALGALSTGEAELMRAHVASCPECAAELEALRAVVSSLPEVPSAGGMPAERSSVLRARILDRAVIAKAPGRRVTPAIWLALAATIAFIFAAAGYLRAVGERDALRVAAARSDSVVARLTTIAQEREAQLAMMTGPSVHVMELAATGTRAPSARMFWDTSTNRWAMFAHRMPMPAKGRAYELWLVTKDKKIPAGMFTPGDDGRAVMHASYAMSPSDLKAIAITEEPAAGVTAPTGPIVLLGTVGT
ncbi:MAG: anti-sigma factor [Gemmatimonadota bacterium]|nr:anti-sigma factor [Gemmatimonadota bacterium]